MRTPAANGTEFNLPSAILEDSCQLTSLQLAGPGNAPTWPQWGHRNVATTGAAWVELL